MQSVRILVFWRRVQARYEAVQRPEHGGQRMTCRRKVWRRWGNFRCFAACVELEDWVGRGRGQLVLGLWLVSGGHSFWCACASRGWRIPGCGCHVGIESLESTLVSLLTIVLGIGIQNKIVLNTGSPSAPNSHAYHLVLAWTTRHPHSFRSAPLHKRPSGELCLDLTHREPHETISWKSRQKKKAYTSGSAMMKCPRR